MTLSERKIQQGERNIKQGERNIKHGERKQEQKTEEETKHIVLI